MLPYDWKQVSRENVIMLKLVGLWPRPGGYGPDLYTLYAFLLLNLFVNGHGLTQVVDIFLARVDLQSLTWSIFITLTQALVSLKVCCFVRNVDVFQSLMATLDCRPFQPRNRNQVDLIRPALNLWKTIYVLYSTLAMGSIGAFTLYPVLDGSVRRCQLPFAAWYPFDTKVSPLYGLTYGYQAVSIWLMAVADVNIDTVISALMMYVGCQCDMLCDNLKNLRGGGVGFGCSLVDCVAHHRHILRFAEDSNKFFDLMVLGQFFTSAVSMGLAMFQLSLVGPLSNEGLFLLFYCGAAMVEVFLYCWFGNEVENKSSQISWSAFEADWTGQPVAQLRNLCIFIVRAQRPIKMTAVKLFAVSLVTFTTILRSSWSYFVLLQQVNSRN